MGKGLGAFIRGVREVQGLSQADVAKELRLSSPQFVSNIERGIAPLPRAQAASFARILKIEYSVLLDVIVEDIRDSYERATA